MTQSSTLNSGRVAVVGGGWNGSHIAQSLSRRGYDVTLFESQSHIFSGISGKFGIRIHSGPHYPRSLATRKACHRSFNKFCAAYPLLVNWQQHAFYMLASRDSDGRASKVNEATFRKVCEEFQCKSEVNPAHYDFNQQEIVVAYDIEEPSAVLGLRLQRYFEKQLYEACVIVKCNTFISQVDKSKNKILIEYDHGVECFDHVINTTSYKQLLPNSNKLPLGLDIVYQPCLALVYEDLAPGSQPISFIVMDGWFPCLMPYDDRLDVVKPINKYIMTHGKWTIMGSYHSLEQANTALGRVDSAFVRNHVRGPSEAHMSVFWPEFRKRFRFKGWKAAVLAKIKTNQEFRGAIVFQDSKNDVINIFPGKITNIFDAEHECHELMNGENIVDSVQGCRYVKDGVLYDAASEISEAILDRQHTTCELQTFRELLGDSVSEVTAVLSK